MISLSRINLPKTSAEALKKIGHEFDNKGFEKGIREMIPSNPANNYANGYSHDILENSANVVLNSPVALNIIDKLRIRFEPAMQEAGNVKRLLKAKFAKTAERLYPQMDKKEVNLGKHEFSWNIVKQDPFK
jgi:hypothetical protein